MHLSDILAMMAGEATGADALMYEQDPHCTEYMSITPEELDRLVNDVGIEFEKVIASMGT